MTEKRRIIINVLATYGRSLYSLVLGLFTARWVLQALGTVDFGLFGLIGGLTGMVTFVNQLLASAVGRFYAYYVGAARKDRNGEHGIFECRQWFNTALAIHTVVPTFLLLVGYPIGRWAVENFLAIPVERIDACVWVWRCTCISCYVGMLSVPFRAMYTAKQEIAELTLYSVVSTTIKAAFIFIMTMYPEDWLVRYSACVCVVTVLPEIIIIIRALSCFSECSFEVQSLWNFSRVKQLAYYAFARFWAEFASMFMNQGNSILVNKYMSAGYNASMTIGGTAASQALTLSGSIDGAFWPAITNKAGEGDVEAVKRLCYFVFRISTVMVLIFAVPLALEIHEVLQLWLVNPPDFAAEICIVILIRSVLERMSVACVAAINGLGVGVMRYSWTVGWVGVCTVFVTWICFALGLGMWSIFTGLLLSKCATVCVRLFLCQRLIGFPIKEWVRRVLIPMSVLVFVSAFLGWCVSWVLTPSFSRVIVTTIVCETILIPLAWFYALTDEERSYIRIRFLSKLPVIRERSRK